MSVAKRRAAQESQLISIGGDEDLLVGMILQSELVARFTHEYGVPGAPVLFRAQNDQLLSALFARKDNLLHEIKLHVYLLGPFFRTFIHGFGQLLGCVEKVLGWSVEIVERLRKPAPEEVLKAWAAEWAKEGKKIDWQKLLPPRGFQALPRRWVVERSFAWICHNRRMSKDYERLCVSGEAFVYAALSRLMVRRLARA